MAILPEAIYRLKAIPSKIPMTSFSELIQIFLKFVGRHTRPSMAKAKNTAGGTTLPDFRPNYKATEIKTVLYWHRNRHRTQWKRTESPEMGPEVNPGSYGQWVNDIGGRSTQLTTVSSTSGACKTGHLHGKQWDYNISTHLPQTWTQNGWKT